MKKKFILALCLFSVASMASEVQGTLMLKGSLKSKVLVNGVMAVCKLKVDKVKNLLEEDSLGYPGYQARIQINLDGSDFERGIKVKLNKDLTITNMHVQNGVKQVKDLEYFSSADKVTVTISSEGRLVSASFPFEQQTIKCNF